MFAAEPFAKVNQLAAMGTKRIVFTGEPIAGLFAGRAFDRRYGYLVSSAIFLRSVTTFSAADLHRSSRIKIPA